LSSSLTFLDLVAVALAALAGVALGYLASRRATAGARTQWEETLRAHDDGAARLIDAVREQLAGAVAARAAAVTAQEAAQRELASTDARLAEANAQLHQTRDQFEADRGAIEERVRELIAGAAAKALNEANAALLDQNRKQFADQRAETVKNVETLTKPLNEGIQRLHQSVVVFDKARAEGAEGLRTMLETMTLTDETLRASIDRSTTETAKLATALRDNRVRGRWGEIGLRNVLEKVGLTDYCDFVEQAANEDGKRPDVVIRLPGDREVAVDAKVPFEAYMSALEATDSAEQQRLLVENANALRSTVRGLALKGYQRTAKAIGVAILYVQIESVVAAALSVNPTLVEEALDLGVVIATPATLLAYLRAFSREWSLYKQSLNAEAIVQRAHELLDRLVKFAELYAVIGGKLDDAVAAWNRSVGSFDGRLVVTAKQIAELSGTGFAVGRAPREIETAARELRRVDELEAAATAVLSQVTGGSSHGYEAATRPR
jgi:DNA recombination protein RmuC